MPTEYFRDDTLDARVAGMVGNLHAYPEFNALAKANLVFLCAFVTKTGTDETPVATTGDPVRLGRVSAADHIFLNAHYKIIVDHTRWDAMNETGQDALLHRALMHIEVDHTDAGALRLKRRRPDVSEFTATVSHFGAWTQGLLELRERLDAARKAAKQKI